MSPQQPQSQTYTEIIRQALRAHPLPPAADDIGFSDSAESLGDDLYRLCVEFGLSFNDFRNDVMAVAVKSDGSDDIGTEAWLDQAVGDHGIQLVLLALELMPEDHEI